MFSLSGVPNGGYGDTSASELINNDIRRAAHDQLAKTCVGSGATQVRMIP
jgi:hypothetical protein